MHTFVRVVESGSFTAVARELDTTQSAISKQVAWLEAELGESLMIRTTRSRSLTEAGRVYFEEARRLLAEIADLEQLVRNGPQRLRGSLRVAASVALGDVLLMPVIDRFLADNPELHVDLRLSDNYIDLVEQGIDVAIRIGKPGDGRLHARQVGTSQRIVVAAPAFFSRYQVLESALRHPNTLARQECLIYTGMGDPSLWEFQAGTGTGMAPGSRISVRVAGRWQSNSSIALKTATLAGLGVAFAPQWMFSDELASGHVRRLLTEWEPPILPIFALTAPERRGSMRVQRLIDALASGLQEP